MRNLTTELQAEFAASVLRPILLVEIKVVPFGSPEVEYVRGWQGTNDIEWDGKTWSGVGLFLSILPISETSEIRADGVKIVVSGMDSSNIEIALDHVVAGFPVTIWFASLSEAGEVIADPYRSFSGRLDAVEIAVGGQTATISLSFESDLIRLQIPNLRYWTHQAQQKEFPGDTGFSRVEELKDKRLNWGFPTGSPALTESQILGAVEQSRLYRRFVP